MAYSEKAGPSEDVHWKNSTPLPVSLFTCFYTPVRMYKTMFRFIFSSCGSGDASGDVIDVHEVLPEPGIVSISPNTAVGFCRRCLCHGRQSAACLEVSGRVSSSLGAS